MSRWRAGRVEPAPPGRLALPLSYLARRDLACDIAGTPLPGPVEICFLVGVWVGLQGVTAAAPGRDPAGTTAAAPAAALGAAALGVAAGVLPLPAGAPGLDVVPAVLVLEPVGVGVGLVDVELGVVVGLGLVLGLVLVLLLGLGEELLGLGLVAGPGPLCLDGPQPTVR